MTTNLLSPTRLLRWRSERDAPLAAVRVEAERLREFSDADLRTSAENLRRRRGFETDRPADVHHGFALVSEALRRTRGVQLYDQQLLAAFTLLQNAVAEMQTGEGKTFACAPAVFMRALAGHGVHVCTPNTYLAARDCDLLRPAFERLGVSVGLLPERCSAAEKRPAYQCDITYGTAYEFGFDFLRDQLALRHLAKAGLGEQLLRRVMGVDADASPTIQRGLHCAIVDEIDHVLLDDAVSPLVLSQATDGEAADADAYLLAREIIQQLQPQRDYAVDSLAHRVHLTAAGQQRIHAADVAIPVHQLLRTWSEYVEQTLQAELLLTRDVHYVVVDDAVQIVEASTGRIFSDRTWRDGLHQAVEAKENLPITPDKTSLAQITRQRFFRLYKNLAGMTGTAVGCEAEFQHVYGLSVTTVPLRRPANRELLPLRTFATAAAKLDAVASSVREIHATGRPVLVGTKSIADSHRLATRLTALRIPFQLLNGRQDADEAAVIAGAGERGAVTIATNLAGRGTDIRLGPGVRELGGLHVIVAECNESGRVDRQLIGRCSRQGDPGSAQIFVSSEDAVLQRYGRWLVEFIYRHAQENGELLQDISPQIGRLQHAAESADYAARCALMRRDISIDSLLAPRHGSL